MAEALIIGPNRADLGAIGSDTARGNARSSAASNLDGSLSCRFVDVQARCEGVIERIVVIGAEYNITVIGAPRKILSP